MAKKKSKTLNRLASSRAVRYLRTSGDDYLQELGAQSETRLGELEERRTLLLPTFLCALIATALVWIVALAFPRTSSRIFSLVADQQLPRYGTLLTVLAMAIPFAPPFVAAFALGRLLWPAREPTKGVMASFDYAQKANQRWLIVVGAGIVGGLNCFLLLVALLNATGN